VPISPWHHPRDRRLHLEIVRRLRRGATLVAARSNRSPPFAFLHLELRNGTLFIDLLAVDASQQNKHWGTELMRRAEHYGIRRGCTVSRLFVDEANDRALRFYGRLGYQVQRHIKALKAYELAKLLAA